MTLVKDVRHTLLKGATVIGFCDRRERLDSTPTPKRTNGDL